MSANKIFGYGVINFLEIIASTYDNRPRMEPNLRPTPARQVKLLTFLGVKPQVAWVWFTI